MCSLGLVFKNTGFNALSHVKNFKFSNVPVSGDAARSAVASFYTEILPFALKSSRTSTYEITRIHVYTHLKHVWGVCVQRVYMYVRVFRCICMEVYMYVRVFIGVNAWTFICMCERL